MADTSVVLPDAWVSRLLVRRHGDAIAIALEDEDDWEALTCCTIDGFEDVASEAEDSPCEAIATPSTP